MVKKEYHFISYDLQLLRENIKIPQMLSQTCEECYLTHQAQIYILAVATSYCVPEA